MIFVIGLGVGKVVDIPGWSPELLWASFRSLLLIALLAFMLMPLVALFACAGRGYLPPLGWAFLTLALAQIAAVFGWGDWFPWSVPALPAGFSGQGAEPVKLHSYLVVLLAFIAGIAATFSWWQNADQAR
jgi:ABC-2 type transport system permease protein